MVDTFSYSGERYAVSFHEEVLSDYDVTYRVLEIKPGFMRKVYKTNGKRIETKRRAVICVVRRAWTGTPYSGIAVLNPNEKKKSDVKVARALALRRALKALCSDKIANDDKDVFFFTPRLINAVSSSMYRAYRTEMLRRYNPVQYQEIVERRRQEEEAAMQKAKAKEAKPASIMSEHKAVVIVPVVTNNPE